AVMIGGVLILHLLLQALNLQHQGAYLSGSGPGGGRFTLLPLNITDLRADVLQLGVMRVAKVGELAELAIGQIEHRLDRIGGALLIAAETAALRRSNLRARHQTRNQRSSSEHQSSSPIH